MIFEVCIDSAEGALSAQEGGAQRVELCANLVEGGTTPSLGMIQTTRKTVSIDVNVIIRPRGGDFYYSALEFEGICQDILAARQARANGVVIGLLLADGRIDVSRTQQLIELARPLSVTFHRAFDMCRDVDEGLESLVGLGIDRILTSGKKASASEGISCIAHLVGRSAGRIKIMAGGGINASNITKIVAATGVDEVHFSARKVVKSPMTFHNLDCFMGKAYQPHEYEQKNTDANLVHEVITSLR